MFKPIALFIGLRYTRAKRRNHFISFISLTSMLGIALGVMALITVLSVMNGFDYEIRSRIFGLSRQVTISTETGTLSQWQSLSKKLLQDPIVKAVAPFITGQGMFTHLGQIRPVLVTGILPAEESRVSQIGDKMIVGKLSDLRPGEFGVIVGKQLAEGLGLALQDKITLMVPEATLTLAGVVPRFKRFTVVGIFKIGTGFGFDNGLAFIHLADAQKLFRLGDAVSAVRLQLYNLYAAPRLTEKLIKELPNDYQITNWTQEYGDFFQAIKLEKTMMFLMLLLIIAVAAFNLVATLVMVVADKKADIAILRTFGATPKMILATFMVQGTVVGVVGTLLGLITGVTLALNITDLVTAIEHYFHVQLFASNIYYVNYLPSKLAWRDAGQVCAMALAMSLIATIYPAWRAARTQPAEALRYE